MTNYKEMMNGKREIPISSCPSQVADLVYGTGSVLHQADEEPAIEIEDIVPAKKGRKVMRSEREQKLRELRRDCGYDASLIYCAVDTENRF